MVRVSSDSEGIFQCLKRFEVNRVSPLQLYPPRVSAVMDLTSSLLDEVLLHVVTVDLGAAEDDSLVHFVLFDGPHCVLAFQYLYGFRPHFWKADTHVNLNIKLIIKHIKFHKIRKIKSPNLKNWLLVWCCLWRGLHQSENK